MKVRSSFVSNSSTSSYLVISIKRKDAVAAILDNYDLTPDDEGYLDEDELFGAGLEYCQAEIEGDFILFRPEDDEVEYMWIGREIEIQLRDNQRLEETQQAAAEDFKSHYGIETNPSEWELDYGEWPH
jgi:hypothetical protein